MTSADDVDRLVDELAPGFSGVVRIDDEDGIVFAKAYGLADRRHRIPMTLDTQLAVASGSKTMTALAVVRLIEDGVLDLDTTARSLLGDDLPLIDDAVTVEHLLAHRSGIGDYLDEEGDLDLADHPLPVPVHTLATTEEYLAVLGGFPQAFPPDQRFAYCNGGYVVLALLAERAAGVDFHDLVADRVLLPAGMHDTAYLRSDELPERAAVGYLSSEGMRTNVLHLPVRGSGDGGAYVTVADVHTFWEALFAGRIVSPPWVERMVAHRSERYGLGFWLHESRDGIAIMEGSDTGVSFRSVHDRTARLTHTVIANTTDGAWPMSRALRDRFGG